MNYFINEAWTKAIDEYISYKNNQTNDFKYKSFLVTVINLLAVIYSDLDLLNPTQMHSADTLKTNLSKYGYEEEKVRLFLMDLQKFYEIDKSNERVLVKKTNQYFIDIQKKIIDMFILKKINYQITEEEIIQFKKLLYISDNKNDLMFSYNYVHANDIGIVNNYFNEQISKETDYVEEVTKSFINYQGYEALGYSYEDVNNLDSKELENVNRKVYEYFGIRENAINKEYLLENAISSWLKEQNKVTSGNGFVDILLVISVIATITMLIAVVTVTIL